MLKHSGIVTLYRVCENDKYLAIVLEKMDSSLDDISIVAYPIPVRVRCAYQLALGLEYLDGLNILHADIKPENVFVTLGDNLCFKWGDLGASVLLKKGEMSVAVKAISSFYVSPEQLNLKVSRSSEVFCFGSLMYFIMSGERPFNGCTVDQANFKILNGDIPSLDDIEIQVMSNLINDCWNPDPEKRPSISQVVTRLKGLVGEYSKESFDEFPKDSISYLFKQLESLKNLLECKKDSFEFIKLLRIRIESVLEFGQSNVSLTGNLRSSLLILDSSISNYRMRILEAQKGNTLEDILRSVDHDRWFRSLDDKLQRFIECRGIKEIVQLKEVVSEQKKGIDVISVEARNQRKTLDDHTEDIDGLKSEFSQQSHNLVELSDQVGQITETIAVGKPRMIIGPLRKTNEDLIGRDRDFLSVRDKLLNKQSVAIVGKERGIEIEGEGGIGKTALASCVARDVAYGDLWKDIFPDGVVFLTIGKTADMNEGMVRLAYHLKVDLKTEEGHLKPAEIRNRIREKMLNMTFLFVIDDVWSVEQLNMFVGLLGPRSRYLMTSRLVLVDIKDCVPIGALSKDDSIELLERTLKDCNYFHVRYKLLEKMAFVARGVPQCLIALANQMVVRKEHVGESKSFESVFVDICGELVVEMQYKDIQDKAFYFLTQILKRNSKPMVQFVKSISVFPSSEEEGIPRSVLDALCLGLDILFTRIDFEMLAKLDFLKIDIVGGVVSKLFFHDLQIEFAQIIVGQEQKDYHRFMIQGYQKQSCGLFYNIKDEYFLNHFLRHLKDGNLTDFIEEMANDGGLAVWLWERSGYRSYLVELLKIASETLNDVDHVSNVLRILEEDIDPNGQSLLFTMSCFLDSNSPYIETMVNFIQKRNEPVAIADFIYEKEERSIPCLFDPAVTSKHVIVPTKRHVFTIFEHSFNQISEIECLHALPSEDSQVIVIQKKSLKGYLIQILDSRLVKVDEIEVPGDIDYCRSVSNDGRFITFHDIPPGNSYLLDMNRRKIVKYINMGAVVAPNGLFFVVHSGSKVWVIPVDLINGREVDVVAGDLENFSSFECKEHVREVRLSNNHVFVKLTIETSIIEIDSNLSFGLKKDVGGRILSTYSNYLVTTGGCYDILKNETICPDRAYPLDSSNGLNWMERDVGTMRIRLSKQIHGSNLSYFHESVSYLARHNETNFVELIMKDDFNQRLRYNIDVLDVALSDSDYLAIQTKSLNIFVFDLNSNHCVNLGKQGGDFAFSNDSKYIFFFGDNGVMRWTLSGLNWYDGNGLPKSVDHFESKEFLIPGVIKAALYQIINTILSFNDGWIFKHPLEDPDKKYPVIKWPLVAPLFSISPKNDCFGICFQDAKSWVLFDNSYQVIDRVFSLTRIAGVTCCNSQHFLSLLTPSKVFRLPYPFLVNYIFSSNDRLILCHDDKMFPVIVKGPREEESSDPGDAWVVDKLKKAFTKPSTDEEPHFLSNSLQQSLLESLASSSIIGGNNTIKEKEQEQLTEEQELALKMSMEKIQPKEELTEEKELEMAIRMSMEVIHPKDEMTEDEHLELTEDERLQMAIRMSMEVIHPKDELTEEEQLELTEDELLELAIRMSMEDIEI